MGNFAHMCIKHTTEDALEMGYTVHTSGDTIMINPFSNPDTVIQFYKDNTHYVETHCEFPIFKENFVQEKIELLHSKIMK